MPTLTKLFTVEETSQHNTKDDCWIVIDGKVYDVSAYLDEHPGGDDVILAATGKDATDEFEDAGHSESARELMDNYCIGELDPDSQFIIPPELEIVTKEQPSSATTTTVEQLKELTKQYWAVPVAAVGLSVVIGVLYYARRK